MIASPARYSLFCALVLGGLAILAMQGARLGLPSALLLLPLVAWPAWIGLAHPAAVRKAQARAVLREGESPWWGLLLGSAILRQAAAVPIAILAAWSVGWTLIAEGWLGFGWILAAALGLWLVATVLARQTGALKPYARLRPVLLVAPAVTGALLTLVWALVVGVPSEYGGSLALSVAAEPRYEGSSSLLAWAVDATALASGARAWAEGYAGPLAAFWRIGGAFGQFWLLASVFAGCLLPSGEARRILRASDADVAPPAGLGRSALAGCLAGLLLALLLPLLAEAEAWATARQHPRAVAEVGSLAQPGPSGTGPLPGTAADSRPASWIPDLPTPSALRQAVEAERIGDLACPEGTIAGLDAIDESLRGLLALRRQEVEAAARVGFDSVRSRIPAFLDGYYSLTAEYVRTFRLVAGDAEAYLQDELTDALAVDDSFAPFRTAVAALEAPLPAGVLAARNRLLTDCDVLPRDDVRLVVTAARPEGLLQLVPDSETLAFEARLAASGVGTVAGGVAGAVAGKLIAKLVAKEAFGLAVEGVAKLAVSKTVGGLGGAAAGAGAGALAGSVVPGVGTTVGAVVGGVMGGLAIGVATDYAMIRIEEMVSREAFEAELLHAIDEAEAEFLGVLFPPK